jgi:hypothetical protein
MNPLHELVALDSSNYSIKGQILLDSYHPLPWLLGDFSNVGYYEDKAAPPNYDCDFMLVQEDRIEEVETHLHHKYFTNSFHLRDSMDEAVLYLDASKFAPVFPGRKPDFIPAKSVSPAPPVPPAQSVPVTSPLPAATPVTSPAGA